jgi:hypothetical protein
MFVSVREDGENPGISEDIGDNDIPSAPYISSNPT